MSEPVRSRQSRTLAEAALVRIVRAYGSTPEFVVLGGLVPDLLCRRSSVLHVGTTDVDVQVNLEVAGGSTNAARLEVALVAAGFTPDEERVWRWQDRSAPGLVVKVEFLADLDAAPNQRVLRFDDCEQLGAVNLRGTSFAARDWDVAEFTNTVDDEPVTVSVRVAGLAGYLLAKAHAAHGRRASKDWYDIVYVLLHNDHGDPRAAGAEVARLLGGGPAGATRTALTDLVANFADPTAQGSQAYVEAMLGLYPEMDGDVLVNDAMAAVDQFVTAIGLQRV